MKKLCSLLLALAIVLSLALPTFASSGSLKLEKSKITVTPAMKDYTSTDLFGNFKGIMPGDTRTEAITISNWALQYDYVTVYMEAKRHPEEELQTTDPKHGKDLVEMHDFLSKLDMTVKVGNNEIFHNSPDQEGALSTPKKLGDIKRGKSMTLDVALFWYPDANLDDDKTNDYDYNKYANRVGEVDWVFYFEGHDYPDDNPKTGDYIIMGAATAMVLSGAALAVLLISKRRRNRK